jgi:hypothetical protein
VLYYEARVQDDLIMHSGRFGPLGEANKAKMLSLDNIHSSYSSYQSLIGAFSGEFPGTIVTMRIKTNDRSSCGIADGSLAEDLL